MKRYLQEQIVLDLREKMVFLGGPRQVGKTTLALSLLSHGHEEHPAYLNWDYPETRKLLREGFLPSDEPLIVLDEIHKFRGWRNLVKGYYDRHKNRHQFLITGSARLDYYRFGGDSLQGRYHYLRLHPLSLPELKASGTKGDLEHLLKFGGFPEPFLKGDEVSWRRWQRERIKRVMDEDLRSLENVEEITTLQLLVDALPSRVGSILSINSLREDLDVSYPTVKRWLQILDHLYMVFHLSPFGAPKIRAVKKEQKLYLWDWSLCENAGARFENLLASHLLKYCHYLEDTKGHVMELRFIRDTDKREIDFVILKDRKPIFAVECKTGEKQLAAAIPYFSARTSIPIFYQVHLGKGDRAAPEHRARILPLKRFLDLVECP